ncbi:MAG: hypothetical protein DRH32_02855 [Deltaproteobacteria bacterium]|nr:MAG: hypothetical protein DRH32_02855 [Deltaproteobacteria bacterium]
MRLKPKQVKCDCGHVSILECRSAMCVKCGQPVFYSLKDKKSHKRNHLYVISMLLAVITFLTYIFIELIAVPLL